jgi:hypothetical protein
LLDGTGELRGPADGCAGGNQHDHRAEHRGDRAAVIVYILKGEQALAQEEPSAARRLIPELRRLVGQYIAEALRER